MNKDMAETLVRTGPGTRMGNLMRRYWVPILLSREIADPDGPQVRVQILGEKLLAFRDTQGGIGLIDEFCSHRGTSLFFGRNEEAGLRCVYHGWKFSVDGMCIDMPSEPAESDFKWKVRAVAYPCQERGGIVWTYMGTEAQPPPLPALEWNLASDPEYALHTRRGAVVNRR